MPRGTKRSTAEGTEADEVPSSSPGPPSPNKGGGKEKKKPKTPPTKKESDVELSTRLAYEIRWCRVLIDLCLFYVRNADGTNGAYVRRIAGIISGPAQHELKTAHKFKGGANRRAPLGGNTELCNARNRCIRKFLVKFHKNATYEQMQSAAICLKQASKHRVLCGAM